MHLRYFQDEALTVGPQRYQAGVNNQIIEMATGAGKTPLLSNAKDRYNLDGRMLVLVHREELAEQAADKIRRWNPKATVGIEMASHRSKPTDDWVVASVPTIGRAGSPRLLQFDPNDFGGVITDEAHHAAANSYKTIYQHFGTHQNPKMLNLGVTATAFRSTGDLGEVYDKIVYRYPILKGIRDGYLSDLRGIRVFSDTNIGEVEVRGGDFVPGQLANKINNPKRNELVVQSWLKHGQDRQTIGFTAGIEHAQTLAEAFKRYGVAAEAIWGDDPLRAEKLTYHRQGHIKVILNGGSILTEGNDDWRVACIIMARDTKSPLVYTQALGRGTRIPEGIDNLLEAKQRGLHIEKEDCLVIDVVDASKRHTLMSLPSLFGLNEKADPKGRAMTEILDEVEEVQKANPCSTHPRSRTCPRSRCSQRRSTSSMSSTRLRLWPSRSTSGTRRASDRTCSC